MITRSPTLANLTALAFSIYELALGGAGTPGQEHEAPLVAPAQDTTQQTQRLPVACSLLAQPEDGGTHFESWLQARETLSASYALRVHGPGVSIDQGGDLSLVADETALLGEVSVSSPVQALDASLTVTVDGRSYLCPLQAE